MLTKGAIGNLVNRYRAVLKKCNLINTFGSLAVASMLVLGGAGVAAAAEENVSVGSIYNQGDVTYEATKDITVEYAVMDTKGATINLTSGGDTSIGTLLSAGKKANITINSGGDVTVGSWVSSSGNSHIDITCAETFSAEYVEITNKDGGGDTINISAKNINIDAGDDWGVSVRGGYYGFSKETAANIGTADTECVTIKGSIGLISQYEHADINVYGKKLVIEASGYGIYTGNNAEAYTPTAEVNVYSDHTKITMTEGGSAIVAFSDSTLNIHGGLEASGENVVLVRGQSTVNINQDGKGVVKLDGDIEFNNQYGTSPHVSANNTVNINLTTPDSYLNGNIYVSNSSISADGEEQDYEDVGTGSHTGMNLGLSNGATWASTEDSFVNNLDMENGVLEVAGNDVNVGEVSGNGGTIKTQTSVEDGDVVTGSVNVASVADGYAPEFNVVPVNAAGETLTADDLSAAQLASVIEQTISGDASEGLIEDATASTANGIVNNGFTTDSEGNITAGGGASSVTKAVLETASVNTVALDKILTNDVRKRLGDIRTDQSKSGVWMRWDGGKLKGNSGLTNNFNTIQIGGDTKVADNWRLGVAGSFTHGDGDFDRGSSEMEGFSFAAYATWIGDNGMFADVVARLGQFGTEIMVEGQSGDMNNRVASLSGEYGWRFNLCEQFFIEPQVELAYTYVSSDDLEFDTARFSFDSVDSLTGRLGLVAGWNLPGDRGNVYARASVVQQFMGDAKVTGFSSVAPTIHETDGDDTWLEYGIGANVKLTDKTYLWADVERTEGADVDEEWRGTVGVRFSF